MKHFFLSISFIFCFQLNFGQTFYKNKTKRALTFNELKLQFNDFKTNNDLTKKKYALRMTEAKEIYTNILKNELDFSVVEYQKNKLGNFAIDKKELINNWIKFLKRAVLLDVAEEFDHTKPKTEFYKEISLYTKNSLLNEIDSSYYNGENISTDQIFNRFMYAIVNHFDIYSTFISTKELNYYYNKKNKNSKKKNTPLTKRICVRILNSRMSLKAFSNTPENYSV